MTSRVLVVVGALALVLIVLSLTNVAAQPPAGEITIAKETTNGDHTTKFDFTFTADSDSDSFSIPGGEHVSEGPLGTGTYTVVETVPSGWILRSISCSVPLIRAVAGSFSVASYPSQIDGSSWTVDLAHHSVTIEYAPEDIVICTFTNDPAGPVGGVVIPANTFAIVAPWLAVIGLVGCISTVVLIVKRRGK